MNVVRSLFKAAIPRWVLVRRLRPAALPSVLLTFDDGPHPDVTPAVLDRLDSYGAKAVFFLIGKRIDRAAHLPAEILRRGHRLGNHTYLHRSEDVLSDARRPRLTDYYRDSARCQDVIKKHAGIPPLLFRPPGGRLTLATLMVPKLLGLRCVTWSADIEDWRMRSAAEARIGAEQLLDRIMPGDIVLLHDDNACVLEILDALLPGLKKRNIDLSLGIEAL